MTHRRVVVTGMGVCAANGTGVPVFWESLKAGRSGIGPITAFEATGLCSRIAGQVDDLDAESKLGAKIRKRTARFAQLALVAAHEAVTHAGWPEDFDRENVAVVVGSGIGGFDHLEREHQAFVEKGIGRFHPLTVPMIIPNMAAGAIAMDTGCKGPNFCPVTACASGAHAIGNAMDLLRAGRAEVAIAGSAECTISPWAVDGYCLLRALSTRNDSPQTASRPFSATRDGFVIAEGAGILILETLQHARARGAKIYAEVAGCGMSSDGHHITAPDPTGRGAVRAMRAALDDAGLRPDEIQLVNAHGTSTPLNDATETRAIKEVFGDYAYRLAVNSTKSMIGHCLGGAAGVESVVSVLTLMHQLIHPTINLNDPDPECDLDYVPHVAREAHVDAVMCNAFGFGGHNGVLVFRKAALN
jgi:3-oxoacyl-[acyl-carrier-protein] synthase II